MFKTAVTRITHSCHLIEIGGRTFLTDPWFSTRPGYYQGEPIALGIADLPRLDGVLISHEHYDPRNQRSHRRARHPSGAMTMTASEDFLNASLHHGNLQVDTTDPSPRPMIAILDARPGLEDTFRAKIIELVRAVRSEPGCITFTAYEARDTPGRFYLYEIYTDAAAFDAHLKTGHVHAFISAIPALSTGGPGNLIRLNEIPIPDSDPATAAPR